MEASWDGSIKELEQQAILAIQQTVLVTQLLSCARLNGIYRDAVYGGICTDSGNSALLVCRTPKTPI